MALGQDFVIVDTPKRISKFTKNEMRVTASKTLVDCFGISRLTECVCVCATNNMLARGFDILWPQNTENIFQWIRPRNEPSLRARNTTTQIEGMEED